MFKTAKFNRISQNIVHQIRQLILKGELRPGDRLPPEKELADRFGVSKASLREAFRALEALGLIEVRQGVSGGAFVKEVGLITTRDCITNYIFFQNTSIEDFTQVRSMLEPQNSEIAAIKATDADLEDIRENLVSTKKRLDSGEFSYELDIDFHTKIAAITQNSIICLIIDAVQSALINVKKLMQLDYEFSMQVYTAHKRIYEALCERDPAKAGFEMLKHIKEVEAGLIAHQNREVLSNEQLMTVTR